MNYLAGLGHRVTPQSEPLPGQRANSAGGHTWVVDRWTRLRRFLVLGSEGGSYYVGERELTLENVDCLGECLREDGERVVAEIVAISEGGRAPKNDPALFALAMATKQGDLATRRAAFAALPRVARMGTHLFHFASYLEQFGGWGRGTRNAIARWYTTKAPDALAYQLVKYRQRDGWSHRDLLRLAHPVPIDQGQDEVFRWVTHGEALSDTLPTPIEAYRAAQVCETAAATVNVVRSFHSAAPREILNPDHLADPGVWAALLDVGMPMTALIRNLATMTRVGLLKPLGRHTHVVCEQLNDEAALLKARIHPIAVLAALTTYVSGRSPRGGTTWEPVAEIVDALDRAFYASFGGVEVTGKRYVLALDVSGSMSWGDVAGVPGLTPRVASAALALVLAERERQTATLAFAGEIVPLTISPRQRLDDVLHTVDGLPFGRTDCAAPMLWALKHGIEADVFVVLTDSETWSGHVHPTEALRAYRRQTGIDAKLVVCAMVANPFSIADPNDAGMLDLVGFDTATPNLIADFARGLI